MLIASIISWILTLIVAIVLGIKLKRAKPEDEPKPIVRDRVLIGFAVFAVVFFSAVAFWMLLGNMPANESGLAIVSVLIFIANVIIVAHPVVTVFGILYAAYLRRKEKAKRSALFMWPAVIWYTVAMLIAMTYFMVYMLAMILY